MSAAPMFSSLRALFRPTVKSTAAPAGGPIPPRRFTTRDIGKGFHDPGNRAGLKRIVVTVETGTFERIRKAAVKDHVSVAAKVREIIQRGFDAEDQS